MGEDTPEPMTLARFADLAEAYGSRMDRWPESDREAGRAFATGAQGRTILARAAELDILLETYAIAPPSAALQGRILAIAGQQNRLRRRLLRWWEGIGFVGAGLAGVVAGAMAMSIVMSGPSDSNGFYDQATTVFGDVGKVSDATQEAQ